MNTCLVTAFLGYNNIEKVVQGGMLALTTYSAARSLEEPHSHQYTSISLLLNGTHREDLSGKKHTRVPGDIKIVMAGEIHRCYDYQPGTQKINLELTDGLLKLMCIDTAALTQVLQNGHAAKFTLLKLFRETCDESSHTQLATQLLLQQLIEGPRRSRKKCKTPPGWALQLKQLLNDEYATTFELQSLSDILGLHPVTISRYFPLYFGCTLGEYLKGIKIGRSLKLIRENSLSLTEIAYSCGFADQAHFTRTFKAYTGHLPKEYRKI